MTCSSLSSVLPHHRSGRVRTLAVLKEERSHGAPEIPSAIDSGVENAIAYTFNMILAPAGTPREVVQRLSTAIQQVMANPDFRQRLVRIGVDPITNSDPQKAAAMLRTEIARYKPVIQALALRN
jgi:tripartite-type tricarboxylate transporter receptor subunit TctC